MKRPELTRRGKEDKMTRKALLSLNANALALCSFAELEAGGLEGWSDEM